MSNFRRTHTCGELRESDIDKNVTLCGWVHRIRHFGGLVFIDIRDRFGITQITLDSVHAKKAYTVAEHLRAECVIVVRGKVVRRKDPNHQITTGLIEIIADTIELLSEAAVLPLLVADDTMIVNDETKSQYRYLDMRKGVLLRNLVMRHKAQMVCRSFLDKSGFVEISTPILGKSTPEGARDYLVPSRVHPGSFYALPQSPQLYKQILMVGGLDRYFQFATCFRDEDLRADRQPEFAQLDMELSFATEEELFPLIEGMMQLLFKECLDKQIPEKFIRMRYDECLNLYGTDKPDLRFGMTFVPLSDLAERSSLKIFQDILANQGIVKGFTVPSGADLSRKELEGYATYLAELGIQGLTWMKRSEGGVSSQIAKYIAKEDIAEWIERLELQESDISFIIAGPEKKVHQALDHLRRRIAKNRGMIKKDDYAFLWVTDFPLFTVNIETGDIESEHHPFTSPNFEDMELIDKEPLRMRSSSYDLVVNGYELASGSQRIHDTVLQEKIFQVLGMSLEERREKFGFFVDALRYGTPPHLGIALGFDRLMMIMVYAESIRDVIAFPKTQKAQDLMTQAPSRVSAQQLQELQLVCKQ